MKIGNSKLLDQLMFEIQKRDSILLLEQLVKFVGFCKVYNLQKVLSILTNKYK